MRNTVYIITFTALIVIFCGCGEKGPENLWTDRPAGSPEPKILNIVPEGKAEAGVLDIVIQGENFAPSADENFVYFQDMLVDVLSASSEQITALRPKVFGDSINVKVVVQKSAEIAKYDNYIIDQVTGPFGLFLPSENLQTIEADKDGNIYVYDKSSRTVQKITPDGEKTTYGSVSGFSDATDMRFGPDGSLYIQRSKNSRNYYLPIGGGDSQSGPKFNDAVSYFDFDQNGNMFAGGNKKSLNLVRTDGSSATVADYTDYEVRCVRVYQNHVYLLAQNVTDDTTAISGVYRNAILSANGEVGPSELVLDWATTGEYANSEFLDMTFSVDGDMYIATDKSNPILMVSSGGVMRPLYKDILTSPAEEIVWSGTILYQRLGDTEQGLMWIAMGKEGAPYYGRGGL